jgi:hypothetical protein
MARQNRWSIRISFILVLVMALVGLWYALTFWTPSVTEIDVAGTTEQIDWVEAASAVGEQAVQLLLGATSGQ